jgi:orotidine-5'-phosphate decarboxylase
MSSPGTVPDTRIASVHASSSPADRLIVALDFPSFDMAMNLVDELQGVCRWFKVGMELYYATGNRIIETLRGRGHDVFLDLKLHDIPNTVAGAVRNLSSYGASLLTVHAGGGERMMHAAAEVADRPHGPTLLAVTVLTSLDATDLTACGVADTGDPARFVERQVLRLAELARKAGIDGAVCSAQEVAAVRQVMGPDSTLVIPGIRPAGGSMDDQSRTATPAEAITRGASMLVVGRPITKAQNPRAAAEAILDEIRTVI